jgi:2'-5' RNA ligase
VRKEPVRTFIAVELSEAVRRALGRVRDRVSIRDRAVRWVRPASIHLTLKFLGEIDLGSVPAVSEGLEHAALTVEPFSFAVRGFGCFPHARNPRVFWAAVEPSDEGLAVLNGNIEREMAKLGFKREKRAFKPHLTLARIKGPTGSFPLEDLGGEDVIAEQDVDEVILFQSELKPSGAVYVPLATVPLAGGRSDEL